MVGKLLYEGAFCGLYCGLFCVKIYTKKNFIDKLEKSNYYTLDLKLIDGNFFYYDMLKNHNIIFVVSKGSDLKKIKISDYL